MSRLKSTFVLAAGGSKFLSVGAGSIASEVRKSRPRQSRQVLSFFQRRNRFKELWSTWGTPEVLEELGRWEKLPTRLLTK